MSNCYCLFFLVFTSLTTFAQTVEISSDTIHRWDEMDLATTKWTNVKHVFVPSDLKSTTLLLENHTLEQHKIYFHTLFNEFYLTYDLDTTVTKYSDGKPHFIQDQEKENHHYLHHYKGEFIVVNEADINNYDVEKHRYVLKKILKIQSVNPDSGEGEAYIEYYFHDRKENIDYPHINAGYHWLVRHL